MKVLAISASPRTHGNTAYLLDNALAGAAENSASIEKIEISKMQIRGCQGDLACKKTGRCGVRDEMHTIYEKIDEADLVLFASPVYMSTVNSQLKAVQDRLFRYMKSDYTSSMKAGKRAALLVTQANSDEASFLPYLEAVPFALRGVGFAEAEIFVGGGLWNKDDAAKRLDLQERAFEFGKRLTA